MEALEKSVRGKVITHPFILFPPHPLPREKNALNHVEVLHEDISLWLGAQIADRVSDPQLDGALQSG